MLELRKKVKNQVLYFIIQLFIHLKLIKTINIKKTTGYKLCEIETINEDKKPITFDNEYKEVLKKKYNLLRKQKTLCKDDEEKQKIDIEINKNRKYLSTIEQINEDGGISESKINLNISETNGRAYSYFTQMHKKLRECILINGNKTTTVDFANSQPAILANILMNDNKYNQLDDVILFYNECINGNIYTYIADKLNISRNKVKEMWMKIAYGLPYLQYIDDECTVMNNKAESFYKIFPNVIKFIDVYKNKDIKDTDRFSSYLQKIEAKITNPISEILTQKGIINITVFDEFIFEEQYRDEVINIIKSYLDENLIMINLKGELSETQNTPITEVTDNSDDLNNLDDINIDDIDILQSLKSSIVQRNVNNEQYKVILKCIKVYEESLEDINFKISKLDILKEEISDLEKELNNNIRQETKTNLEFFIYKIINKNKQLTTC